jgi:hypothetical protein
MADGAPSPVERVFVRPPMSRVGPLTPSERKVILSSSPVAGKYDETIDRESAFELLSAKANEVADAKAAEQAEADARKAALQKAKDDAAAARAYKASPMGKMEKVAMATAAAAATQVGRSLVRGLLTGLFKKR